MSLKKKKTTSEPPKDIFGRVVQIGDRVMEKIVLLKNEPRPMRTGLVIDTPCTYTLRIELDSEGYPEIISTAKRWAVFREPGTTGSSCL